MVHLSVFLKASFKTILAISSRFFFRWVKKQQNRVSKVLWQITNQLYTSLVPFCAFAIRPCFKVLLIGLYKDQDSPLKMLRTPNNVVNDVMSIVWDYLTWQWQVGLKDVAFPWFPLTELIGLLAGV